MKDKKKRFSKMFWVLVGTLVIIGFLIMAYLNSWGPFYQTLNDDCEIISSDNPFFVKFKWDDYDQTKGCVFLETSSYKGVWYPFFRFQVVLSEQCSYL